MDFTKAIAKVEKDVKQTVKTGLYLFESTEGNSITGQFVGIERRNRDSVGVDGESVPRDGRRTTVEIVVFRTDEKAGHYSYNSGLVDQCRLLSPGDIARVTCTKRGSKETGVSKFLVELIMEAGSPDYPKELLSKMDENAGLLG